ncbi:MAG TPA: histidine--tRNA ligase [Syntrophobacteria bacterium]|nr:histidine--tRNA ligase [Syntrophobacteria bacterium]
MATTNITGIKGFNDILPDEVGKWQLVESVVRRILSAFGFREIRIPILEKTELFARGIGETTDIVEKEMYTFEDRNRQLVTLRPEATASVVRAFIEHGLHLRPTVRKLYTIGPMFRHERPQKGRYRQFHQINVEAFGIEAPMIDAEVIYALVTFLEELHVADVEVHLNSLGCPRCRPPFRQRLEEFLAGVDHLLCDDCKRRRLTNPLRVMDCKVSHCREVLAGAPRMLDFLGDDCREHFQAVQDHLTDLQVSFTLDPSMVRGLDYYTRTAFEVLARHLGAQNAVGGGGRYDGLMKAMGGPDLPGVGFAIGMERLIMLLGEAFHRPSYGSLCFLACLGAEARRRGFRLLQEMRRNQVPAEMDYEEGSLKAQMRKADRMEATHVVILGEEELARGKAILRSMETKVQEDIPLDAIVERLTALLPTPPTQEPGRPAKTKLLWEI